jgi:hypothetical protein
MAAIENGYERPADIRVPIFWGSGNENYGGSFALSTEHMKELQIMIKNGYQPYISFATNGEQILQANIISIPSRKEYVIKKEEKIDRLEFLFKDNER